MDWCELQGRCDNSVYERYNFAAALPEAGCGRVLNYY